MMRVKSYWIGVYGQVRALEKRFMRDGMSLFFTFLFPLIFLLVFGAIFNNQTTSFDVAIINHSQSEFAKQFVEQAKANKDTTLKVKDVKDMQEAREKLKHSELSGIIELPADFGKAKPAQPDALQPRQGSAAGQTQARPSGTLRVLYAKGSEQSGNTLTAIMGQIIDGINKGMGQPEPPLKVAGQAVGDEQLKTFDYTFTGLLAFSLMSMGIFGLANQMPTEKQKGSYRRLRASPFTAGQLILAMGIHYTIVSLLSAAMMLAVGMSVFHFNMRGDWLLAVPFITLAALLMVGFGLLIGGWAKNENQSAPLGNLVAFPMMFLSGTFFPSFMFPEWLRTLSQFIPMTPVTDGLRLIMTEHASLGEVLPYAGAIGLWMLVVYVAAIKLFRWE
jgi:ABC-2 type transporter